MPEDLDKCKQWLESEGSRIGSMATEQKMDVHAQSQETTSPFLSHVSSASGHLCGNSLLPEGGAVSPSQL